MWVRIAFAAKLRFFGVGRFRTEKRNPDGDRFPFSEEILMFKSMRACLLLFLAVATGDLLAQVSLEGQATEDLSASSIEARLNAVESDSSLNDLARGMLQERYREALEALAAAVEFEVREKEFRDALSNGPDEIRKVRSEIERLEGAEPIGLPGSLGESSSEAEIESALAETESSLRQWQDQALAFESELVDADARPTVLRDRLFAAQGELRLAGEELERVRAGQSETPDAAVEAERIRLRARQQKLAAEISMLEQEDASDEARIDLLEAQRDLARARSVEAENQVLAIRALASRLLGDRVREAEAMVEDIRTEIPDMPPLLLSLEEELQRVNRALKRSAEGILAAEERLEEKEDERRRVNESFSRLRRELEIGGLEGTLAQLLLEHLRSLPSKQEGRNEIERIRQLLNEVQREFYEFERDPVTDAAGSSSIPPVLDEYREKVELIEDTRESLTADLKESYRRWIRRLASLELVERQIIRESEEQRDFAVEKLFWVRDSRVGGEHFLRNMRDGLRYCFGLHRWNELGQRLGAVSLFFYLVLGILLAGLLLLRGRIRARLEEAGKKTRHISSDRFANTAEAFLLTLLLVLPGPLMAAGIGWGLLRQDDSSEWSHGFGRALIHAGWFTLQIGFLIGLCRKGGLGDAHFQWDARMLRQLGRKVVWLIPVFLPTVFTLGLVLSDPAVTYLTSLGCVAAVLGAIGTGLVIGRILHPRRGVAAMVHEQLPDSLFGKWRSFWFSLVVLVAVVQVGLLLSGFVFTGILLLKQAEVSATAIVIAILVFGLLSRWFLIRERKLALEEALEKRAERREEARAKREGIADEVSEEGDESNLLEIEEEEEMDLDTVSEQTKTLVSFFVGVGLLAALWMIWTEFAPVFAEANQRPGIGGFTLSDFALIILVVVVVLQTIRNLPGLLEITVLRRFDIDPGTRTAITTLAKYAVIATGAAYLFNEIG
ncbi:MAG: hypothetical protein AAGC68_10530, partial [Verrucomicrobiota bacterium]